jgi:hypothetical protein
VVAFTFLARARRPVQRRTAQAAAIPHHSRDWRPERRRLKNFSMKRPEMTNLNHQYAIRRVDMDFS